MEFFKKYLKMGVLKIKFENWKFKNLFENESWKFEKLFENGSSKN